MFIGVLLINAIGITKTIKVNHADTEIIVCIERKKKLNKGRDMTEGKGLDLIISKENPQLCSDCGQKKELRPYGKNGAYVCFECAMKDEPTAKNQFRQRIIGKSEN